uniref:Uncharacterized protein n=1 Tax=Peronospora matthiolae TaxID=2874970 RepID=A0AAV1U663_9STRA
MQAHTDAPEDRREHFNNNTTDRDGCARNDGHELCSSKETEEEKLRSVLHLRQQEVEARLLMQLDDHDVATGAEYPSNEATTHAPAAIPIDSKKSKLTQWIEQFEAQQRGQVQDEHERDPEASQVSHLTAWLATF